MNKELGKLRKQLREAKKRIKCLEGTLEQNKPTFYPKELGTRMSTTLNGHKRVRYKWEEL